MPPEKTCSPDDGPRSLRDRGVRERREALLDQPHVRALTQYVRALRKQNRGEVPYFDPLDGGIDARVLFLFEKPGPMTDIRLRTAQRNGSGFISRNNDDESAAATFRFMAEVGIPRELTVIWNVVPWWDGALRVRAAELRQGAKETRNLINLLPNLQAVVFVGKKANRARRHLEGSRLALLSSAHPSPKVRAVYPDLWRSIPSDWAKVKPILGLK